MRLQKHINKEHINDSTDEDSEEYIYNSTDESPIGYESVHDQPLFNSQGICVNGVNDDNISDIDHNNVYTGNYIDIDVGFSGDENAEKHCY